MGSEKTCIVSFQVKYTRRREGGRASQPKCELMRWKRCTNHSKQFVSFFTLSLASLSLSLSLFALYSCTDLFFHFSIPQKTVIKPISHIFLRLRKQNYNLDAKK